MPTFEELHAADNAHGKSQLNTLLLEFSATLARLPNLQRELQSWLAQDAQAIDFATLYARAESMLVLAADWLLDYDHLPVEIRQAKDMQDFMRTASDTVTCRTVAGMVQKFKAILGETKQNAEQKASEAAQEHALFSGWQKHDLDGKALDVTSKQWAALTDCGTGLMWAVNCGRIEFPCCHLNWDEAHAWVETVNRQGWCGYRDWRLPSMEELRTLLLGQNGYYDKERYRQLFKVNYDIWTSLARGDTDAFYVNFEYGWYTYWHPKDKSIYVRMVRSSQ